MKMNNDADFGYGWSLFGKNYQEMTDMQAGLDYITKFFKSSHFTGNKNPNVYIGFLASKVGATTVNSQIAGLGLGIKLANMSESDVEASANKLALVAGSKVPASISDFKQALINQASSTPLTDMALAVSDTAVAQAFVKTGDTIINVAKAGASIVEATAGTVSFGAKVVSFMPYIVPIGGIFLAYKFFTSDYFKEVSKSAVGAYTGASLRKK